MKIGLNLWIWESPFRTDQHLWLIEKVRALGAEVAEFAVEDGAVLESKVLRRALRDQGLGCSVIGLFGSERDLSSEQDVVRRCGMDYARHCLDLCAEVGAAIFSGAVAGVGSGEVLSDRERQTRLRRASECLHQLGEHAANVGVRFCIEVLNRYESNLINTAAQALELIELTNHPAVGIHLDSFHMNIEEDTLGGAIRLTADRLFHLHASDSHRGTPGAGHVPWKEVAEALKRINYGGYAVIESFNPGGQLAPLARFWRSYAESPDALARQGLDFLRDALRI